MSEVTVIGLGEMGSALAAALLRGGRQVTVWNRTASKAAELVRQGASLAPDLATAVQASPVLLVCLSDYAAMHELFAPQDIAAALPGRTVIQLGTGTPAEARHALSWAQAQGVDYLDGAILAWPSQIGGDSTVILTSGPTATFQRHQALLRTLAGGLTYMGETISASSALFAAVLSYLAGRWIGFSHGALICEAEGLSVASFGAVLADLAPILGEDARHMGQVVEHGRFEQPESTLKTAGGDITRLVQHAEEAGISKELPQFAAGLFRRAIDAGHGAEEHVALIKVLRSQEAIH